MTAPFFFAPDGSNEPTLWEATDSDPIALATRTGTHPRLWVELERIFASPDAELAAWVAPALTDGDGLAGRMEAIRRQTGGAS